MRNVNNMPRTPYRLEVKKSRICEGNFINVAPYCTLKRRKKAWNQCSRAIGRLLYFSAFWKLERKRKKIVI